MIKLLALNSIVAFISLTFAPAIYEQGTYFYYDHIAKANDSLSFEEINVSYDLRLLYGDTNKDGKISSEEYINFDFSSLTIGANDKYSDFKFLCFKPDNNDLYVFIVTNSVIDEDTSIYMSYSDSTTMNENLTSYTENNKVKELEVVNYYAYSNSQFFYKLVLKSFSDSYSDVELLRVQLYNFLKVNSSTTIYEVEEETELIYSKSTSWSDGNFYYFQNNSIQYEATLAMCLGAINVEDYFPTVFSFLTGTTANDSVVTSAQEITYMFVDFDTESLDELVKVDVSYYKLEYDYTRYALKEYTESGADFIEWESSTKSPYSDIYSGTYLSEEYGSLSDGISLNGKSTYIYDDTSTITVFNSDGSSSEITYSIPVSDNTGAENIVENENNYYYLDRTTYYNPDLSNCYNSFSNVEILNNGNAYNKTIESDYYTEEYTYTQINTADGHQAYKRNYSFKPIVDLSTYQEDFSSTDSTVALKFFDNCMEKFSDKNYDYAILIDGATSDEDCTRSIISEGSETNVTYTEYGFRSDTTTPMNYNYTLSSIYPLTTNCHEVYGANILTATFRNDEGSEYSFFALGDPAYTSYVTFSGEEAPTTWDYIINDITTTLNNLFDFENNSWLSTIVTILAIVLGVIVLLLIIRFIRWLINLFKKAFK